MRIKTLLVSCATLSLFVACGGDDGAGSGYTTENADADEGEDGDTMGESGEDTDGSTDGDSDSTDSGDGGIPIEPDNMIDNFEDGDNALIPNGGRQGYWYTFNDASEGSTQSPAEDAVAPEMGGAAGTSMAMHTTGSGFAEWGAGIGIDLNNAGDPEGMTNGVKMPYDSSSYTGIVLMAKGNSQIRASVQLSSTIPPEEGGTCELDCDPHGKVLLLTDEWQQFTLPFDELNQEGWGSPAAWDSSIVVGIQFKAGKDTDFDFWVDEIGFY
ncbi:hypothetical protein PPSIR1_18637 [Plesiocystis pacifica SIR-1]|uniref:CBM11 domain-containing protein n=1 Tax=Plesiocystis pacifica SIR-1 TaxID=391625 RepID=A6GCT6_9BACT|nr:hypothetical protein [Plesiocystis pacifica]EDM76352.1 hypothetical protein PPSIR1_18637 [Plesiocystis pacifica SIR-1]